MCSCHAPAAAASALVIVVIVVADFRIVFFFTGRVRGYFLYLPTLLNAFFLEKIFCILHFLAFLFCTRCFVSENLEVVFFGGVLADFAFVLCPSFLMAFFFVFVRFVRLPAPSPGPPSRKYSAEIQKNSDERRE